MIGSGALIGGIAFKIQGPDFEKALAPPEEASSAEPEAALQEGNTPETAEEEIPVPKMVTFLDVTRFLVSRVLLIDARDAGSYEAGHIPERF